MGKKIILPLMVLFTMLSSDIFAQSIQGGAGVIHVTGDPDAIVATQNVDINEASICFDRTTQMVYFYDPAGTAGVDQWNPVSVAAFADTDTRLDSVIISGSDLKFYVFDVLTNTVIDSMSIPVMSLAPVQSLTAGGDINITDDGNGNYTISFSQDTTGLTISNDSLFYTNESGVPDTLVITGLNGTNTVVQDAGDISVTGTGTTGDPYIVSFTQDTSALTISNDSLFYTSESGVPDTLVIPGLNGTNTVVQDAGDITVTGTGTTGDPYIVSFTQDTTSLSISNDSLFFTNESGIPDTLVVPGLESTSVQGSGDISVTGTGTSGDPYIIGFTQDTSALTISNDTLFYTSESGIPDTLVMGGSVTTVNGDLGITVTGTGASGDPYVVRFDTAGVTAGQFPYLDGTGNISWSDMAITDITVDAQGRMIATFNDGTTTAFVDLSAAPRVKTMAELTAAADALTANETGIAIADDGNTLGLPTQDDANREIGVLFFIKKK